MSQLRLILIFVLFCAVRPASGLRTGRSKFGEEMNLFMITVAWCAALAGATGFYLAARHQALLPHPLTARQAFPASILFLAAAAGLFARVFSPATALYSLAVVLMVAWSIGPLAVALIHHRKRP